MKLSFQKLLRIFSIRSIISESPYVWTQFVSESFHHDQNMTGLSTRRFAIRKTAMAIFPAVLNAIISSPEQIAPRSVNYLTRDTTIVGFVIRCRASSARHSFAHGRNITRNFLISVLFVTGVRGDNL